MTRHVHQGVPGAGTPIGLNDKHGKPVHLGDTLRFDPAVWYRLSRWIDDLHDAQKRLPEPDPVCTVRIVAGEIELMGTPGDVDQYCEIIRTWDDQL